MNLDEHLPLARAVAGRYVRRLGSLVSADDIQQAALIGLWEAMTKHDGSCPFPPYAARIIRMRVIDELRRHAWGGGRGHYVEATRFADMAPGAEDALLRSEHDPESAAVARLDAERALGAPLTMRQRSIAMAKMVGYRHREMAPSWGVTESRIHQIAAESVAVMREHLQGAA